MSEIISHMPNPEEARQWMAEQQAEQASRTPENFYYGGNDYLLPALNEKIDYIVHNERLNSDTKQQIVEILAKGTLAGQEIGLTDVVRDGTNEVKQREYLATVMLGGERGRETARAIVEKGVCGFHATRSQALAGILERGSMMAAGKLNEQGHLMATGEHIYQKLEGQQSVSFSNLAKTKETIETYAGEQGVQVRDHETVKQDLQTTIEELRDMQGGLMGDKITASIGRFERALRHVEENPDSLFTALSKHEFPVVMGINKEYIQDSESRREKGHLLIGASNLGEFRPADTEIPLDKLPVVAVPAEVVEPVQKLFQLFGQSGTKVVPLEALMI